MFVRKAHEALSNGIHLLIVDLFPPNARNPRGIHPLIWDERDCSFKFSKTKPLTCVAYIGDPDAEATFIVNAGCGRRRLARHAVIPDVRMSTSTSRSREDLSSSAGRPC